jgi:acyl-CoA thioesterase I
MQGVWWTLWRRAQSSSYGDDGPRVQPNVVAASTRLPNPTVGGGTRHSVAGQAVATFWMATIAAAMALAAPGAPAAEGPVKIVALGDSLTAGYRIAAADAFPVKLERALRAKGHAVEVVNAGVSGDTAAGGLARLDWAVPAGTEAVIVELGANDALRGVDPELTRRALDEILRRLKARGILVLLAGMRAPPNMGPDYVRRFDAIYPDLASGHEVMLYPFFLESVAAVAALNQGDGIHPTAAGIDVIVRGLLPQAEDLVRRAMEARNRPG